MRLCGGPCGKTCAPDEVCTGRSPLHPYSLCLPDLRIAGFGYTCRADGKTPRCPQDDYCFVFKVQPEAQAYANANGLCMGKAACQAAASALPGGALCVPPW